MGFGISDALKTEAWSWEKNKKFELALLEFSEEEPNRWDKVAATVGGESAKDVEEHFNALVQDVNRIETGVLNEDFAEHVELEESQIIEKVSSTQPLGLSLNIENEASLDELLARLGVVLTSMNAPDKFTRE